MFLYQINKWKLATVVTQKLQAFMNKCLQYVIEFDSNEELHCRTRRGCVDQKVEVAVDRSQMNEVRQLDSWLRHVSRPHPD